jgi:FkbM family methyltransferase
MSPDPDPLYRVFSVFPEAKVDLKPGEFQNFIGAKFKRAWIPEEMLPTDPVVPGPSEDLFEWINLLESVSTAGPTFTMVELGAGFGRWSVSAAIAAKRMGKDYRLVCVEAEPTHFTWLRECVELNGLDLSRCRLVNAAIGTSDGSARFIAGSPGEMYCQEVYTFRKWLSHRRRRRVSTVRVARMSLKSLLSETESVDFVDLDIQGAELDVLESALETLNRKARRVHIATHDHQIHDTLRRILCDEGWESVFDFDLGRQETSFGEVVFQDGILGFSNPNLTSGDQRRQP